MPRFLRRAAHCVSGGSSRERRRAHAANGLGWWNSFRCKVNERLVESTADAIVTSGMRDAGYRYVILDDCWMAGRDAHGRLIENRQRFPSGMAALGRYLHARGLKFGIYSSANTVTCAVIWDHYPKTLGTGSLGHEVDDARTFATWNVDYVKYDRCIGDTRSFATMRDALRKTGRAIVYSTNPEFAFNIDPRALPGLANLWRIAPDIFPTWSSVLSTLDAGSQYAVLAGPGHWNDFDMLEVGRGMTPAEDRAHFSMWAMEASPLIAGNDVRSQTVVTKAILTNREVIALDQDARGEQAVLREETGPGLQVWAKRLSEKNTYAVVLLNRTGQRRLMYVDWYYDLGFSGSASIRDLWQHADKGSFARGYATLVPAHSATVLKVVRTK
ncbi:MAG: glycoside hydrolase family 27 protein [Vulcanimicrobiaceae bacterium]